MKLNHGNSDTYRVLPDNAALNLDLRIPGVKHYNVNPMPTVTKHKLVHETLNQALTDTNWERMNLGVGEDVAIELDTPTIEGAMPMKNDLALGWLLGC